MNITFLLYNTAHKIYLLNDYVFKFKKKMKSPIKESIYNRTKISIIYKINLIHLNKYILK